MAGPPPGRGSRRLERDALRGQGRRAHRTPTHSVAHRAGTRPGRRHCRRGGRRQVSPRPRDRARPPGLACSHRRRGAVHQGNALRPAHRAPRVLVPHPACGCRGGGESARRESVAGRRRATRGPGSHPRSARSLAARRSLSQRGSGAAPPADSRSCQADALGREPGSTVVSGHRGSSLDRCRDPGGPRQPRQQHDGRASAAARDLSPGVPSPVGRQELLQPGGRGRASGRERRGATRRASRRRSRARFPSSSSSSDRATRSSSKRPSGCLSRRTCSRESVVGID